MGTVDLKGEFNDIASFELKKHEEEKKKEAVYNQAKGRCRRLSRDEGITESCMYGLPPWAEALKELVEPYLIRVDNETEQAEVQVWLINNGYELIVNNIEYHIDSFPLYFIYGQLSSKWVVEKSFNIFNFKHAPMMTFNDFKKVFMN